VSRLEIGDGAGAIGVDLPVAARTYQSGEHIATTRSLFGGGDDELSLLDDLTMDPAALEEAINAELSGQAPATRSLGGAGRNADALRERITREWRLKQDALQSRAQIEGFLETFLWPIAGELRITSEWGTARSYSNGSQKPHYGVDIAASIGTPVVTPASGRVTLAEPDMYYEGGCVFIDHGLGLTSIYLHMDEVVATANENLPKGAMIGRVGTKGRSTGPHLCWRLYWRDRKLDPTLLTA
jgi:murein DD-endopeptidase MepM/ murein hydrolase activator NlpD